MNVEEKALVENSCARIEQELRALLALHPVHLLHPAKEAINNITIETLRLKALTEG